MGARGTPLATVQADRSASPQFGGRPADPGNAPAPVSCPEHVLRLARAARAITVKPAPGSIGRCNSRTSGPRGRRLECLRDGRHCPRPVERNHEQPWMVEHVNRSACQGQDTHRFGPARRTARPTLAPKPRLGMCSISASMSRSSHCASRIAASAATSASFSRAISSGRSCFTPARSSASALLLQR
jgi:hypothetical protein